MGARSSNLGLGLNFSAGQSGGAQFSGVVAAAGGATPLVYLDFINQYYSYNGAAPVAILAFPGMNFARSGSITVDGTLFGPNVPAITANGYWSADNGANGFDRMRIVNADQVSTCAQFSDMINVNAQAATTRCFHTLTRTQADGSNRGGQSVLDGLDSLCQIIAAGVGQMSQNGASYTAGLHNIKFGVRCAANDGNIICDGVLGTVDNTVTVPTQLDECYVGINSTNAAGNNLEGYTRRYIMWQTGLSDAQLSAVSALNP